MPIKSAAIIGAGIAGLTAALALARHGIRSEIFEQAEALTEVGAGLQISPNASRILDTLGILDALLPVWLEPKEVRLVSGSSLRLIASVPCGNFARERWARPMARCIAPHCKGAARCRDRQSDLHAASRSASRRNEPAGA